MSTNKDLFKEAIADAKQVREAALANAKAALEEALAPKLQSMISAKLQEMEKEEEDEKLEEVDFISANDASKNTDKVRSQYIKTGAMSESEEELEEDFDLSAILAELDSEESIDEAKKEDKEEIDEAKEDIDEAEETEEVGEEEEVEDEESEMEPTEEPTEEETADEDAKITDLTVDALRDIIKDIIHAELEQEEYETPGDEEAEMGGEEEVGLEMGTEEPVGGEEDEINLEELLAELDALDEEKSEEDEAMYEAKKKEAKKEDEKDEMKEAIETIEALRNELHEQNLLNAKLLYVNKIFKAKNLSESQKLKVIASFDKATTPAQAKELFESIQTSTLGASKKSSIKESIGFASKAAGVAPKNSANTIVESNDVIARMQKLANIIK